MLVINIKTFLIKDGRLPRKTFLETGCQIREKVFNYSKSCRSD